MPQSPSKYAWWDLTQFSQLPSAAPSYFPESHWLSEISYFSKMILVWGKSRSCRCQIWAVGSWGTESLEWFDVSQKNPTWDVMHERTCCHDEAANHQVPIAAAFWIIQIVSVEDCSSLTQNLMQICCSTRSVILNVTALQSTCSLNNIDCLHWPGQFVDSIIVHAYTF